MTLNGWKRIGIIVSVAWIIGAGMYTYNSGLDGAFEYGAFLDQKTCDFWLGSAGGSDWQTKWRECRKNVDEAVALGVTNARLDAALVAFIPVPVGWGFVYLVLFLVGWVRRGFVRPGHSRSHAELNSPSGPAALSTQSSPIRKN